MKKISVVLAVALFMCLSVFAQEFDGYIVRIKENTAENLNVSLFSDFSLMSELDDSEVVELLSEELDSVEEINSDHMLVKVDSIEALNELIDLGIVEYYEEDIYYYLCDYDVSKNPEYSSQKWFLDCINVDYAWNAGVFGNEVRVAVVDSGVYPHDDIKKNLIPGKNYVSGLSETYTTDNSNHGTSVAGIIASECNSISTVGISFKTKIVPLKVTNNNSLSTSLAVKAIYDAVNVYDCDVINLSFGSSGKSDSLYEAIMYAISNNVIVVAAAGNGGNSGDAYPASYPEVISVANLEKTQGGYTIRNSSQRNSNVDIAAPGTNLRAITNDGYVGDVIGTSFSSPVVSAVAALMKSLNPDLSQSECESLIKNTADKSYIPSSGLGSDAWGEGIVDVEAILKKMNVGNKCLVSDVFTVNDEAVVYITNLSDTAPIENCTVIISEFNSDGYLDKSKSISISLSAGENYRLSLTDYNFTSAAKIKIICDHIPGDIDGDKNVTLRDASAIMRYLAGFDVTVVLSALDVDGDKTISLRDASAIMRYLAGYSVVLN